MSRLKRLVVEIHRRSLWQVLGIYLVGSWVGYQVIVQLADTVGLPDWVPAFAIVLFIIGLPIVLATAFIQEGALTLHVLQRMPQQYEPLDPTLLPVDALQPAPSATPHALFTWRKAVLSGITAFLLLAISAAGYMGLRNAGIGPFGSLVASGAMGDRERIVISQFHSTAGDTMLASAVSQAFGVDFAQSSVVSVVEPAQVRSVLQRMSRDPSARLDADLTHEIAVRDNIRSYVTGEIAQAGGRYVIAAKLFATQDGRLLAAFSETAADSTEILPSVDRLSKKLRQKIGESLKALRAEKALEEVSTPSLDALRKYSEGVWAIDVEQDFDRGIPLLEDALAIDSTFAMAWRKLSVAYFNSQASRDKYVASAIKTYAHRERLTEPERYMAEGWYHLRVTEDWNKAATAFRMGIDRRFSSSPNNLGLAYLQMREYDKAAEAFGEAVSRDSTLVVGYANGVEAYFLAGKNKEAYDLLALFDRKFPEAPTAYLRHVWLESAQGNYAAADTAARELLEKRGTALNFRALGTTSLANLAAVRGKLAEASRLANQASAANQQRGIPSAALMGELLSARTDALTRRNPARAIERVEEALTSHPLQDIPAVDRPYFATAELFALSGKVDRARALLTAFEKDVPTDLRGDIRRELANVRGLIAFAEGKHDEALNQLRTAAELEACRICSDTYLALAFEASGQADSAIARYEHYLITPESRRITIDAVERGPALERLAELYERKGDRQKAAQHARSFVELWQNADAELQPRVAAKRALLQRLGSEHK
jgi:eukaryotic-like serine/threonine-protein kinase